MATSDYLSSADLKGVAFKGLIREDVMDKIIDISKKPLPLTDMIGSDSAVNSYHEWTQDKLATPNVNNAKVDGQDATGNDTKTGKRVGNQCQISTKEVQVTQRANSSDVIGRSKELAYQLMQRVQELRIDIEAMMLEQNASVADDGDTVAGRSAGLGAWLETNTNRGALGADGGFSSGIVAAATPGTKRALSETMIRDMARRIWEQGGDPTVAMMRAPVLEKLSAYLFSASARIATLTSETGQEPGKKVAQGAVNVIVTDFAVLELVANRYQQPTAADTSSVYVISPEYLSIAYLQGFQTAELAKVGLAEKREISVDWTLKVHTEEAHGVIADIDELLAVAA